MATTHPPPADFLRDIAIDQLRRHLAPLVFEYFEWSVNESPFDAMWELRGTSHKRVVLRPRLLAHQLEVMGEQTTEVIEHYYPMPFHVSRRFEKYPGDQQAAMAEFHLAVAGIVHDLRFLEKANDIEELEAWIILSQKPQ